MAYCNDIASVPEHQIRDLQAGALHQLSPAHLAAVTHLLVSWIRFEPLRVLVQEALDGGSVLREDFWHPLRPPCVHTAGAVARLDPLLREAVAQVLESLPAEERQMSQVDIQPLLDVFAHAASQGYGVVSALNPPLDAERASRVKLPFPVQNHAV